MKTLQAVIVLGCLACSTGAAFAQAPAAPERAQFENRCGVCHGGDGNGGEYAPGTMYGPHQRQLSARLSKRFRFVTRRLSANLDVSNLLNTSTTTAISTTYGTNWLRPTQVQQGRWAKIGVQFDF